MNKQEAKKEIQRDRYGNINRRRGNDAMGSNVGISTMLL